MLFYCFEHSFFRFHSSYNYRLYDFCIAFAFLACLSPSFFSFPLSFYVFVGFDFYVARRNEVSWSFPAVLAAS